MMSMKVKDYMTNKMNKTLIITGGYIDENFLKEWFTKENYSMIICRSRIDGCGSFESSSGFYRWRF